jgi:predicted metal-dependent peptidase
MAKSKLKIEEEISRSINQLLLKEPFYAHILATTIRKVDNDISTAAVGLSGNVIQLMINEVFFLEDLKSTSQRVAVLKHEVLHLVFKHLFRHGKSDNPELYNIAADLVVNQYIGQWSLPESAVTLKSFPDLNLEEEKHLEYYYDKLSKLLSEIQKNKKRTTDEINQDESNSNGKHEGKSPLSSRKLEEIYNSKRHSDHSKWILKSESGNYFSDEKFVDANSLAGVEQSLNKVLLTALERVPASNYGSIPSSIITALEKIKQDYQPKVSWKRILRIFNSTAGRTEIYHTNKRISKRFGTRPGIKIVQRRKIAVILDTSGSIDMQTLNIFFSEINQIYNSGTQVLIIECDAAVGNVFPFRKNEEWKISGRGGTNFDPAFEYINKNRNIRIDACIYLTDGFAPKPTIKPRCRLLYVVTPDGSIGDHLVFGKKIKMSKDQKIQ